MQQDSKAATGAVPAKKSLGARAVEELKKFAVIVAYLWILFALFALYKRMILRENGISAWNQGFAIVNALIFGKVVLIAQALRLGRGLRKRPLIWLIVGESALFSIVLILFHIAEEAVRAGIKGLPLASTIASAGGGTGFGFAIYAAIFFVALVPFFAIQELGDVLGGDTLRDLLLTRDRRGFKLVKEPV